MHGANLKPLTFVLGLWPLAWLCCRAVNGELGFNPIETVNRFLGDWALRFLLLTLALTPLRMLTGWNSLAHLRRMIGLFAFAYACLHLTSYVALDLQFEWRVLLQDFIQRRYITVGLGAFVLMAPLALTSSDGMVRRLGGRRWRALHRLVFPCALLAVGHYWLMVKADVTGPGFYAATLAVLMAFRIGAAWLRTSVMTASGQHSGRETSIN